MKILFTTNNNYYSKISNFVFREPLSHMALSFTINNYQLVLEISKHGGKLSELSFFLTKNKLVHLLELDVSDDDEIKLFDACLYYALAKSYNWAAYFYLGLSGIGNRFLGLDLIEYNKYNHNDKKFCTHIIEPLEYLLMKYDIYLPFKDLTATTPYMLYKEFKRDCFNDKFILRK